MADHDQVYAVADAMRARGERVSVRRLTRALPDGGSPRDITKLLRQWRQERDYSARLEATPLPEFLNAKLETFGKELWEAARSEADALLSEEMRRSAQQVIDEREIADNMVDIAERYHDQLDALRKENSSQCAQIVELQRLLQRVRADEFWDRVMRAIWEILPVEGTLKVSQIEPQISRSLAREAEGHQEEWSNVTLRKKMNIRVRYENYFQRQGGNYSRIKLDGTSENQSLGQ